MDRHRLAELTSLRLHAEIAGRLADEPELVDRARARVASWLETGSVRAPYAEAWAAALAGPLEMLHALLIDDGEEARALRQASPFAGAIDPRRRWAIWRQVRAEAERG